MDDNQVLRGLSGIYDRIQKYPFKYSDDVGARFFTTLYEQDPTLLLSFFKRYSIYGYSLELNDSEREALALAGEKTTPSKLIVDTLPTENMKRIFNRRTMLRLGGAAAISAAIKVPGALFATKMDDDENLSVIEDLTEKKRNGKQLTEEEQAKLDKALKEMEGDGFYKIVAIAGHAIKAGASFAKDHSLALLPIVIVVGEIGVKLHSAYKERFEKMDEVLKNLDQFCNLKLNRLPYVGNTQPPVTISTAEGHSR